MYGVSKHFEANYQTKPARAVKQLKDLSYLSYRLTKYKVKNTEEKIYFACTKITDNNNYKNQYELIVSSFSSFSDT